MVTPLRGQDQLDLPGLEKLVNRVIDGRVAGLFLLGTSGEAPGLKYDVRRRLINETVQCVRGRVPVLVGITDTSFGESVALSEVAATSGADAVVLATPYYFPAGQTELIGYIEHITREVPLPLMLYNMPSLTKVWFEIDTLKELTGIENIIGVKDSSGDIEYFEKLVTLRAQRPDWSIMMGPEHLLADAVRLGAQGGVCGGANVFPELFVQCYEAATAGDWPRAAALVERIEVFGRIYAIGKYASRYIKATKCALSILGVCDDFMAEPFHRFRPPHRQQVQQILTEHFREWI